MSFNKSGQYESIKNKVVRIKDDTELTVKKIVQNEKVVDDENAIVNYEDLDQNQ